MKKLSLLLLSSFVLSLPACDGSDDDSETQASTDTEGSSGTSAGTNPSGTSTDPSGTTDPSGGEATGDPSDGEVTGDPSDGETTGDPTGSGGGVCVYQCSADEDCLSDGTDLGLTCTKNGVCLNVCETNDDCIAQLSGWSFQPCDSNDACAAGPCVDLGDGAGGCATEPTEFIDCATLMQAEVEVSDIDGNTVTVCGNDTGVCADIGNGDMTCTVDVEPVTCVDTGCPEGFTCAEDGACQCDNDDACVDTLGDEYTCGADGFCTAPGCTDDSECNDALPFDGGEYVCQ